MILKFFNSNRFSIVLIILLIPVVYWIPSWIATSAGETYLTPGTLATRWIENFNHRFGIISSLIALVIVLFNGYLLVQLNTIHIFIPVRTQLPALFYILLVTGFSQLHALTPALISSSLIIFMIFRVFNTYKTEGASLNFLDAGLLVSVAGLLYFPALLFFPFLFAVLTVLRPFNWREWTYTVIGLGLPFIFLTSAYYLADLTVKDYFRGFTGLFERTGRHYTILQLVMLGYFLVMIGYASYFMVVTISNMKIQARKLFMVFLWLFLFSLAINLAIPGVWMEMAYFMAAPVAFLFSHYFVKCRKNWINEILFSLFLILLILQWKL